MKDAINNASFEAEKDIGHMYLPENLRGTGLGAKFATRADRHVRQRASGTSAFWMRQARMELFDRVLTKIKYKRGQSEGTDIWIYSKKGKAKKTSDMKRFHLIEAVDPKTGKIREYVFPIRGK